MRHIIVGIRGERQISIAYIEDTQNVLCPFFFSLLLLLRVVLFFFFFSFAFSFRFSFKCEFKVV